MPGRSNPTVASRNNNFTERLPLVIAIATFLVIIAKLVLSILEINSGKFLFSLDDTYIHLALSEQLSSGHYGINPGEFAAPASSIIWPFLLTPFTALGYGVHACLTINLIAGIGTLILFDLIAKIALRHLSTEQNTLLLRTFVIIALAVCTNLAGLVLTGMEHTLQIFLTTLLIFGLSKVLTEDELPWWFGSVLVLGPLVRYENLAPTALTLALLFLQGRYKYTLKLSFFILLTLGGFSLFLLSHGLEPLPSSVLVKSGVVREAGAAASILGNFRDNLRIWPAWPLVLILVYFIYRITFYKSNRTINTWATLLLILHFLFGRFNWFSRYEIYAVCAVSCILAMELGVRLKEKISIWKTSSIIAVSALGVWIFSWVYISDTLRTPLAANNLYSHQYQLNQFITKHWKQPIAVNDLGLVSYHNKHYVVDLVGLGSPEAYRRKYSSSKDKDWLNSLTLDRGIALAAVYSKWFPERPENWIPVAKLILNGELVVALDREITFYLLDPKSKGQAFQSLERFKKELPGTVTLKLIEEQS